MAKDELVSVIIPASNAERYVAEAIESVLRQSYRRIECIVVDDGSEDATGKIARSFGKDIVYVYQHHAGRSAARNHGLRHARGDFFSFLDADDYLHRDKIADQLLFLRGNPDLEVVYSRVKFFRDRKRGKRFFSAPKRITPVGDILEELLYENFIAMHSPLIRKNALDRIGGFARNLSRNADWEFLLRLAASGARFGFLDEVNAFCRLHAEKTGGDAVRMSRSTWQVAEAFVEAHRDRLSARGIDPAKVCNYHKAEYGKALILSGELAEGQCLIREACRDRSNPRRRKLLLFAFGAGMVGAPLLRLADRATHKVRAWKKVALVGGTAAPRGARDASL